jgi:predicted nucleotidyltransferase
MNQKELENLGNKNLILKTIAGSRAYGTNRPESDIDERGIFISPINHYINIVNPPIEQIQYSVNDVVYFELSKYMKLLLDQNPNVVELLWTDKNDILYCNEFGKLLIDYRSEFLSIKIKESFVGYAMAQLKRIKGHNKWLNNPQSIDAPQEKNFTSIVWNYTTNKEYNKHVPTEGFVALSLGNDIYSLWDSKKLQTKRNWIDKKGKILSLDKEELEELNKNNYPPDIIVKFHRNNYENQYNNWKGYWTWKENRNEKRAILENKFGYDVKHAMHLIRLLRSGRDILKNCEVPVKRKDKDFLLSILYGELSYEQVVEESEKLLKEVEYYSLSTKLPKEPNKQLAEEICITIYQNYWKLSLDNVHSPILKF